MADFVLSCCSTADLTKEHFQQRDISYICFHYALDGVDYPDDLGETMPFDKFYAAMANGAETRTSQVNISEFVDYFTPFLEQGKDILHVCLSSACPACRTRRRTLRASSASAIPTGRSPSLTRSARPRATAC